MNIRASDAKTKFLTLAAALLLATWSRPTLGSDAEVLQPRVPSHLIEEARAVEESAGGHAGEH